MLSDGELPQWSNRSGVTGSGVTARSGVTEASAITKVTMGQERQPHWFQAKRIICAATLLTIVPARGGARLTALPRASGVQTQTSDAGTRAAFEDFLGRVNAYIKLRSSLEATLPKLKPTDQPDNLAD